MAYDASVNALLMRLEQVPWFDRLGYPSERDSEVTRIAHWDEWPGPEDPDVIALAEQSQYWHDAIFAAADSRYGEAEELWKLIHQRIFTLAIPKVPFNPNKDAWYGPTQCVWDAAYGASLMGCHILLGYSIPSELANEWSWYEAGHWPCGYADAKLKRLLVY